MNSDASRAERIIEAERKREAVDCFVESLNDDQREQMVQMMRRASQRSGVPVNELISAMKELGPAARSLGLGMNETAGLMSAFDQAGIDAGKTVAGLSKAASNDNAGLKSCPTRPTYQTSRPRLTHVRRGRFRRVHG